jgi:solute carrier family 20 (sodium-dependent phosphate transporter)
MPSIALFNNTSSSNQVFIAWVSAPGIAGVFAAIIFLTTKYGVMKRRSPVKKAFVSVPIYFFITSSLLASKSMIKWKTDY